MASGFQPEPRMEMGESSHLGHTPGPSVLVDSTLPQEARGRRPPQTLAWTLQESAAQTRRRPGPGPPTQASAGR